MIYISQLIYLTEGQENIFHLFEDFAIPLISKHKGKLLLRLRPERSDIVEMNDMELPYEIHLVAFNTDDDLTNFMHDEDRKSFLHLKQQSVKSVLLIKGMAI